MKPSAEFVLKSLKASGYTVRSQKELISKAESVLGLTVDQIDWSEPVQIITKVEQTEEMKKRARNRSRRGKKPHRKDMSKVRVLTTGNPLYSQEGFESDVKRPEHKKLDRYSRDWTTTKPRVRRGNKSLIQSVRTEVRGMVRKEVI